MNIIERHFAAENDHDVAGALATYVEDVIWDDVGNPSQIIDMRDVEHVRLLGSDVLPQVG